MTDENKAVLTKALAILGFCVTIALIIWLIVMAFNRMPSAFSSLSGIADSINLREEISSIEVTLEKKVVNSGEPFEINWTDTQTEGTYRLGYSCADGMLVLFRDPQGTFRPIRCGEPLSLPSNVHSLSLVASSTKDRFTDVTFRVQFAESEAVTPIEGAAKITIVNAALPVGSATGTPSENTATTTGATPSATSTATTGGSTGTQPAPVHPPKPITTIVYPQSDPNGFTDLSVTMTDMGGSTYSNTIRFTVKNIGTKTSQDWSFDVDLPSPNDDYASTRYAGLKPQEYMVFTMSFSDSDRDGRITVTADVSGDANSANNRASLNIR